MEKKNIVVPAEIHRPLAIKAAEMGVPIYEVIRMGLESLAGKKSPRDMARDLSK